MRAFKPKSGPTIEGKRDSPGNARGLARAGRFLTGRLEDGRMPPSVGEALRSPGRPLDAASRALMESRFGHDFSGVKVHADARAAEAASAVDARAFTVGGDVVFGRGEYAPQSESGRRLLSHELTHVVQQRAGIRLKGAVGEEGDEYERRADVVAESVARGQAPGAALEGNALGRPSRGPSASGSPSLQRQKLPPQSQPGKGFQQYINWPRWYPQTEDSARQPDASDWLHIIPDAALKTGEHARKTKMGVKTAHGNLADFDSGEFSYHKEGKKGEEHEIAEAGALAAGVTQADVDKAVARVVAARAKVHQRYVKKVTGDYGGYMATPQQDSGLAAEMAKKKPAKWAAKEAESHTDWKEGTDASQTYTKWLATARPTSAKDAADKKWQIYKRIIPWEGDPSTINAYDRANVTWGSGFSATGSGGQVQELTQRVLDKSPEAREAFLNAGVTVNADEEYVVVDTDKKWKLHGADADLYIRSNPTLLSLMINVAQGSFQDEFKDKGKGVPAVDPKQAVLDANFETFLAHALKGIPDSVLNEWGADEAALAAHAIHGAPGLFNWKAWAALKSHTITDVAEHIYDKSKTWFPLIVVPKEWRQLVLDKKEKEKKEKEEKAKKEKDEKEKKEKEAAGASPK